MTGDWNRLPWQDNLWQQMITCCQRGALAHAYLLRGMPGVGKFQFAKALAAYLLCKSPVNNRYCGQCKECELLHAGTHPDIAIIEPDEPGRAIRIDKIRQLTGFAHKTAQQGGRRIIIMNPAEAMNIHAANALLKCLEEPGGKYPVFPGQCPGWRYAADHSQSLSAVDVFQSGPGCGPAMAGGTSGCK